MWACGSLGVWFHGLDADDIRRLFRLIDWMMNLPRPMEALFLQEIYTYEEEKHMPYVTSAERFGREAGLEQGLQQGLQQGLWAGIELGLKLKFGADGLRCLPEILRITDVDLLRKIHQAIETANSLDALRRTWSPED